MPAGPGAPFSPLFEEPAGAGLTLPAPFQAIYGGDWRLPAPAPGRPYVYTNFAVSRDGRVSFNVPGHMEGSDISGRNRHDRWLMGLLRARADAVLIGAATLRASLAHVWTAERIYPADAAAFRALRAAEKRRPTPLQVVLSGSGELPSDAALWGRLDLEIVIATTTTGAARALSCLPRAARAHVLELGAAQVDLAALMRALRDDHGVLTLLSEAGPHTYGSLIKAGLCDDEFSTLCPIMVGNAPEGPARPGLVEGVAFAPGAAPRLHLASLRRAGDHLFLHSRYERISGFPPLPPQAIMAAQIACGGGGSG